MTSKTTNKFSPEVRARAVRIHSISSQWQSTVCDLVGLRQGLCGSLCISASAVSCDDFSLGLLGQPGFGCRQLPIWQQCDCFSPLKIANDRAIPMIATPCPIIYPDEARCIGGGRSYRRTVRNSVSLLTGNPRRSASRAAGRPPNASARWRTKVSRRAVLRAIGRTTSSPNRSAKIF